MKLTRAGVAMAVAIALCSWVSGGCGRSTTAHLEAGVEPPIGEVWLTDAQVAEAKLKVEPLDEQDVDDILVTSGKVTFDDARGPCVLARLRARHFERGQGRAMREEG
jgi:hypothetical protein